MASSAIHREPAELYDPRFVKALFDRCSERYITFSYVCSLGFTERWRKQCVEELKLANRPSATGYDLMSGTGEVWPHLLRRFPNIEAINAVDISSGMHMRAIARIRDYSAKSIAFIENDIFASTLPDASADFLVSTFGLKTFNSEQLAQLAQLVVRVLKPGGTFAFIEASDPKGWLLRPLYLFHLKHVLPLVERFLLHGAQDFSMIGTYCLNFGDASHFAAMLRDVGLEVEFKRYFFGCATAACGIKPRLKPRSSWRAAPADRQ